MTKRSSVCSTFSAEPHKEALSLILLLDQVPRNVYRGEEAKRAYNDCDPKARELCKAFISDPRNYDSKELWDNWLFRQFLLMPRSLLPKPSPFSVTADNQTPPVMHSEDSKDHDLISRKLDAALKKPESEAEKKAILANKDFEDKHGAQHSRQ